MAVAVGGLIAGAVLIGVLAGWWSISDAAVAPAPAATEQPAEEKPPSLSELWREPTPQATSEQPYQPPPTVAVNAANERSPQRRRPPGSEAEQKLIQPPQYLAESSSADPLTAESGPAPTVAASMPLPRSTIARTIDRIGYRCGSVASATPVDGAAGVFRISCTSGQSFRASPVGGRYRFRRLARN